jgi:hypothetical protein
MQKHLRKVSLAIGLLMALGTFSVTAQDGRKLRAEMAGRQEVPVVSTEAQGTFEATIDDTSVSYTLTYEGLEGGSTLFAHIHLGQMTANGGVMTFLCGGGTKPTACPNGSGTVQGVITASDIMALGTQQVPAAGFDEFVRALRNGTAYANVHTTASPGGEIRGQIKVDNNPHPDKERHEH